MGPLFCPSGIALEALFYRRGGVPDSHNVTRIVPNGSPMPWGPSGITRDVSDMLVVPLRACVDTLDVQVMMGWPCAPGAPP